MKRSTERAHGGAVEGSALQDGSQTHNQDLPGSFLR